MTNVTLNRKLGLCFFSSAVLFHSFLDLEANRLLLCKLQVQSGALMRAAAGLSGCDTDCRRHSRDVTLLPSDGQTLKYTVPVDPHLSKFIDDFYSHSQT